MSMQWEWLEAGNRIAGIKIKGIQDFAEIKDMSGIADIAGIGNITGIKNITGIRSIAGIENIKGIQDFTEIKSAGNLEWVQWLSAGVNLFLLAVAAVCFAAALIYLWRNYRLEELITEYQKKAKEESEKIKAVAAEGTSIYPHMVPMELLEILQLKEAQDFSADKHKNVQAVNMSVNSNEFSSLIHSMGALEVFAFINRFLERAVPLVYESGGMVETYWDAGMTVLFLKDYEQALVSAVSICELWNELSQQESQYDSFTIGMTYEDAIAGTVGNSQRMELSVLSAESGGLSDWLRSIAVKYYARILVADSYAELIADFQKKFHTRLLGYVYIKDTDSICQIYDVFDGDAWEVRSRKRQTKILFEKGVSLYAQQQFAQARQYFIEVLKTDRFDRAAKEYIYRCEKLIQNPDEAGDICMERYG